MGTPITRKPLKPGRDAKRAAERRYAEKNLEARRTSAREAMRRKRATAEGQEKNRRASAAHYRKHPKAWLNTWLKATYGITLAAYEELERQQGGVCAICGRPERTKAGSGKVRRLAVDHCHRTKLVRGLLCGNCNKGLGHFQDNADVLLRAVAYVTRHSIG